MNTILIDTTDDEDTQNAFSDVSEGQTIEVTLQVILSEKTDKRIAGSIRLPVEGVRRLSSDIDEQSDANELDQPDDDQQGPKSTVPGGVLRSMSDG